MIRYLENKNIDRNKWDNSLLECLNGMPYAYSWYLDLVAEHWDAYIIKDYEGIFPVIWKNKLGRPIIYQPWFMQQGGLFYKDEDLNILLENILHDLSAKFGMIDLQLNAQNPYQGTVYKSYEKVTYLLDLKKSYKDQRKNYSTNTKRNIKKAEKKGLSIKSLFDPELLVEMIRENQGIRIKGLSEPGYQVIRKIIDICIERETGEMYGVFDENDTIYAANFFMNSHGKLINLFSSSNEKGRRSGAMAFNIDFIIKKFEEQDLMLDFEGSMIPTIARFYKSFGADPQIYQALSFRRFPWSLLS